MQIIQSNPPSNDQASNDNQDETIRKLSLKLKQRGFFENLSAFPVQENSEYTEETEEQQQTNQKNNNMQKKIDLKARLAQLQQKCQTLTQSNRKLWIIIKTLENYKVKKDNQTEEVFGNNTLPSKQSELQSELQQLQKTVTECRANFYQQRQKITNQIFKKEVQNQRLQEEIQKLRAQNHIISKKYDDCQKQIKWQSNYSQSLQAQVRNLKTKQELKNIKVCKPIFNKSLQTQKSAKSFSTKYECDDEEFNNQIFNQMEKMMKKLMEELQHQRKMKSKMNVEVNRLNQEIKKYEEQLKQLNSKIYYLQLENIKKNIVVSKNIKSSFSTVVNTTANLTKEKQNSSVSHSRNQSIRSKNKASCSKQALQNVGKNNNQLKQYTKFTDLIIQKPLISWNKKIWIGIKILNLFDAKIKQKNFKEIKLQDLIIKNLNSQNTAKMQVIDNSKLNLQRQGQSEQNLFSNVYIILQCLLNQVPQNEQSGVSYISEKHEIQRYLQQCWLYKKQGKNINPITSLKKYFQEVALNYLL